MYFHKVQKGSKPITERGQGHQSRIQDFGQERGPFSIETLNISHIQMKKTKH